MRLTPEMLSSVPFQYAADVRSGKIVTGRKIKLAVERFYRWIDEADEKGYYLDHSSGMHIVGFYPDFLRHTVGKLAGKPFHLAPFQAFTLYNVFAWKRRSDGLRRIRTVYDKRAKKNGKSAEMAGLALYCASFDFEMEAQIYVGATKEEQARICWRQARQFIMSPVANPALKRLGFNAQQKNIGNSRTGSFIQALGGDSKTQDGINAHLSIIDEYHAHKDDSVKENLESSSVQRNQPLVWHITTAGTNVQSACKRYEDSVIEVLEGRAEMDHLWIMIHDLDEEDVADPDGWENEACWIKANPLLGQGLEIERIREEYQKAILQRSKIRNFKTKHLNMWVDQQHVWILNETWMKNKVDEIPLEKFTKFGAFAGLDLSTTTDLSAYVILSEPDDDGDRFLKAWFFCPKDTIEYRTKADKVPYQYWADAGYIIATPGNVIDYDYIEDTVKATYLDHRVKRAEIDQWNATQVATNLQAAGVEVSFFSQSIGNISTPTKEFEKLVIAGKLKHDGNPVLAWMLASCVIYSDANDNIKVHKGQSHAGGRRIDGIVAAINALGGSMSPEEETGKYSKDQAEIYI